jgi:hypothetical protein
MTQPDPTAEAESRRQAQEKEYGTWVAADDINVGNALAYAKGHPVPASNVERHGYDKQGLVVKAGTKAANEAQGIVAPAKTESGK